MEYPEDFTGELVKKPICGVLAVAMVAGVSFARATEVIKKNLMPHQKRHGGKTYHEQRCNALKALGVHFREVNMDGRRRTLAAAILHYCRDDKTYMITTSGHVVTVRNRVVADQVEVNTFDQHGSRRCITRHIVEIVR